MTDGQTTRAKTRCLPTLRGGDITIEVNGKKTISSCIYMYYTLKTFDKKNNDFCKNCISGFGLYVVISICVEVIYISYGGKNLQFSAIKHVLYFFTFYMHLYAHFRIDFVLGIKGTLFQDLISHLAESELSYGKLLGCFKHI